MENNNKEIEIIETSEQTNVEVKEKKNIKEIFSVVSNFFNKFKSGKIKNEALFKRGGYSLAITALVLAGLIVFNWLVGSLAKRFHLEFDMTPDKKNSISEENIDYIEGIEDEVNITVCSTKENYANYVTYYYGLTAEADYFTQAVNLIDMYPDYNKNIKVNFLDPQGSEYAALVQSYSSQNIQLGDILVTSKASGSERLKLLTVTDIFNISEDQSNYYSGGGITVTSSKVETALTSAIAYVTNAETKKIALITGHSAKDYTTAYKQLLQINNYEIDVISDTIVANISNEYDAIAILSPSIDFLGDEVNAISAFLDNDGKLGKGLIYFADATCPALPNFHSFLQQWGISVGEGILFETYEANHAAGNPTAIGMFPAVPAEDDTDDITEKMGTHSITDYNVPMTVCETSDTKITSKTLVESSGQTVVAPLGAESTWADYTDEDKKLYSGVIQAVNSKYDDDNNRLTSYIMAFSSVEFVESSLAQQYANYNQEITLVCTERAANVHSTDKLFTAKIIENESFSVTEDKTKIVRAVFVVIVPLLVAGLGIYVYIRRRNAR